MDKNRKRGEAGKSQKQLQSVEKVKLKKSQKEGPELHTPSKHYLILYGLCVCIVGSEGYAYPVLDMFMDWRRTPTQCDVYLDRRDMPILYLCGYLDWRGTPTSCCEVIWIREQGLKKDQEKDKIGSKWDKNGKRVMLFDCVSGFNHQTSSLKPYVPTVILEKIIINLEDEVVSLLEKEKANLEIIESLKLKGFESSENAIFELQNQSENDCQVVEKECHQVENSKVIAPGMFKLNVSQSVSPISVTKTSFDSKNVENKTKRKRHKRKASKQIDKQMNNDVSRANSDFVHFSDLDNFSSVRRPKQSSVIWKKKGSSNTSSVDLSSVSHLKLNKDVKRYSCKDLLSCNNSHLGEMSSAYDCNDAMNVFCNSRLCDSFDENKLFIFDDESVRISPVSKMPLRKSLLII
nr:hypothetical protein [Tanacetum cinerariifolium]